jgi:hypothetical protein
MWTPHLNGGNSTTNKQTDSKEDGQSWEANSCPATSTPEISGSLQNTKVLRRVKRKADRVTLSSSVSVLVFVRKFSYKRVPVKITNPV